MKLVFATHNENKVREMRELLPEFDIVSLSDLGITDEPIEDGETFEENARIKARAALEATGLPSVADDSGLCVDALGGAPGVYSARYGGTGSGRKRILSEMFGISDRAAHFTSALVCLFPDGGAIETTAVCDGKIAFESRGTNGFGYDSIFELADGRTMAELENGEKNRISHRGKAVREFVGKLEKYIGQ
ncbi:non-canonical purine NTP pyrophosphatase [Clostridia bacterium]|nr:non-canonical purine NTP pyrophosphatase [Clostridia bacterium]